MSDQQSHPGAAMRAASEWYARLASGENTEHEQRAWLAWLEADPEHRHAWQKLEQVTQQFGKVPREVGMATLQLPPSTDRRYVIKHLTLLLSVGALGTYAYREQPWREMLADYSTRVGEHHQLALADGSQLHMNTDTAVNIRYTDTERRIELIRGEIFIETAQEANMPYRPLRVETRHGTATAMGTKFTVRYQPQRSKVSVFEGTVAVLPRQGAEALYVQAGESVEFTSSQLSAKGKAQTSDAAWTNGMIVAYAMRLQDFVEELSRYKSGMLRCDPAVAELRISGSFPTGDMESVLHTLENILPIKVQRFTRFWVTLTPA
ncbi:FecR family protein [Methylobacillus rhizosphaerae]|uniref:FecR family protein n=1 Tax=Methylobacillus rhizosphaerae TaxID=551994 RepID=A0A238YZI7_9PROT|nr:FecR domain-containing protein [Methylobacillus rhizosphaerae]SNR76053.1 FecR family protein [Methylobacillus rhizosphaerae]